MASAICPDFPSPVSQTPTHTHTQMPFAIIMIFLLNVLSSVLMENSDEFSSLFFFTPPDEFP